MTLNANSIKGRPGVKKSVSKQKSREQTWEELQGRRLGGVHNRQEIVADIAVSFYSDVGLGVSIGDNRVKDFAWQAVRQSGSWGRGRLSALDVQV